MMVLPQNQINNLIKRLDIANVKEHDPCIDYMASVKDTHLREILAKEILTYEPPATQTSLTPSSQGKLENLMKVGSAISSRVNPFKSRSILQGAHASFHKIGRLEDEWPCILPILIKRIVLQYADITRYKKESLCRLEKPK